MKDLAEISSQLSVEMMISSGSLLYLYRNCSLGQSDMDFLLPLVWWNTTNNEKLRAALEKANFKKELVFGHLEHEGYQEAWFRECVENSGFSPFFVAFY